MINIENYGIQWSRIDIIGKSRFDYNISFPLNPIAGIATYTWMNTNGSNRENIGINIYNNYANTIFMHPDSGGRLHPHTIIIYGI